MRGVNKSCPEGGPTNGQRGVRQKASAGLSSVSLELGPARLGPSQISLGCLCSACLGSLGLAWPSPARLTSAELLSLGRLGLVLRFPVHASCPMGWKHVFLTSPGSCPLLNRHTHMLAPFHRRPSRRGIGKHRNQNAITPEDWAQLPAVRLRKCHNEEYRTQ